jgi:hypothetical protein
VRAFGRFWYEFIVGDDWRIAAGVVAVLAFDAVLLTVAGASDTIVALAGAAGIVTVVMTSFLPQGRKPVAPPSGGRKARPHGGHNGLPALDTTHKKT